MIPDPFANLLDVVDVGGQQVGAPGEMRLEIKNAAP